MAHNNQKHNVYLSPEDISILVATINSQLKPFYEMPFEQVEAIEGAYQLMGKLQTLAAYLRTC